MVVREGRKRLDTALGNPRLTILLLSGTKESKAGKVHDTVAKLLLAKKWEPWYRCFLVTDLGLLTSPEKTRWFGGAQTDQYAVVGGSRIPKRLGRKGPINELLYEGRPDILEIEDAFGSGDEL